MSLFTLFIWNNMAYAESSLRSAESIFVENGKILESGILADSKSQIFIEFIQGDKVAYTQKKETYQGEILPPTMSSAPKKAPRPRMREILTFELITDSGDEVNIVSQYSLLPQKERRRLSLKDENLEGGFGAQLLTRIYKEDEIGLPKLWFFNNETEKWERVGGIISESSEPDIKIFSAIIQNSGTFTLWDENPPPTYNPAVDPNSIELAEESPFPSVDVNGSTSGSDGEGFNGNQEEGFVKGLINSVAGDESEEITLGDRTLTTINNDREEGDFAFDFQLDEGLVLEDLAETDPPVIPALGKITIPDEAAVNAGEATSAIPTVIEEAQNAPLKPSAPLFQSNILSDNIKILPKSGSTDQIKMPWVIVFLFFGITGGIYFALKRKY